jgi:hypothetical protein
VHDLAISPDEQARKLRNRARALRASATLYVPGCQCFCWRRWEDVVESNRLETEIQRLELQCFD